MLCQNCENNKASFHYTELDNNHISNDVHLCNECAVEQGYAPGHHTKLQQLVQGLVQQQQQQMFGDLHEGEVCPICEIHFEEFRKNARFGCPHDYEAFEEGVEVILERIHGCTQHVGKVPAQASKRLHIQADLTRLKVALETAIKDEAYEEAARIRDEIQTLENSVTSDDD